MMKNYDKSVKINHNPNWPYIVCHAYRILIISGSGSGKTNVLLNLKSIHDQILTIFFLYLKDPLESKYQLLINGRDKIGTNKLKNPKAYYPQTIDDVYENLEDYNWTKKLKCQ